jgi:[lysine-biosynthesis-protein LysW]--L-2-aminoadipate ligase
VGVVYDQIRWEEKTIIETAKKRGIKVNLIDSKSTFFNITGEKKIPQLGDVILQRCISYFRSLHLTALLEAKGYSVVNNFNTTLICGNKLLTTLALTKAKIPTPKTSVAFTPEAALKALKNLGYPAILKPIVGSWGRLIAPLKDRESAQAIFEEREYMYPLYQVYYIQEMIKRPPRDIRCFVVGDEVIAAIYRYSLGGDWKTNIARGGTAEYCKVTSEIEELSLKAAEAVGGGILGVDMMESKEGMLVHEINHTVEFQATETGSGVNIPKFILGYLIKKIRK